MTVVSLFQTEQTGDSDRSRRHRLFFGGCLTQNSNKNGRTHDPASSLPDEDFNEFYLGNSQKLVKAMAV